MTIVIYSRSLDATEKPHIMAGTFEVVFGIICAEVSDIDLCTVDQKLSNVP